MRLDRLHADPEPQRDVSGGLSFAQETQHFELARAELPKGPADRFDHPELAIIMVTEDSLKWFEETNKKSWPWPRDLFGILFRGCAMDTHSNIEERTQVQFRQEGSGGTRPPHL